jgi:prevent-host-death family protein
MARPKTTGKSAPQRIPATDAARRLGELLNRMRYGGEQFVITRRGKDVAALVLIPVDEPTASAA